MVTRESDVNSMTQKERQRKHRRVDYTDDIKTINNMFIKPCQQFLGPKFTWEDTIQLFFSAHFREVLFCKAKRDLELRGRAVTSPHGQVFRKVKKGDPIIVRTDTQRPAHNEVIFRDQYFLYGEVQMETLREDLEVVL